MIRVSVIIPFRGDQSTLLWVLDGFAQQNLPEDVALDVRVGGDGCSPPDYDGRNQNPRIRFSLLSLPRSGVAQTKNLLLKGVQTDVLIFANADTRPTPDLVSTHVRRLLTLPEGCMVLGSAPYESSPQKTVFDVLKAESPMIFFYRSLQAHQSYDYRHAWNLNVSVRHSDFHRVGGFAAELRPYGYEDLDFAYKLMREKPAVFYEPEASVLHRHPMSLDEYLDREEALGCVAPNLDRVNPTMFRSLFGSIDLQKLASDYRLWTSMDIASHRWALARLRDWAGEPDSALGERRERTIMTLYQMHIPLKRFVFRLGFLRGLGLMDDSQWTDRGANGLWQKALR